MLSAKDKALLRTDFIEWTGGYGASEVEPEKIDLYVELCTPHGMDQDEVDEYLTEWACGPS